jgi:DNA-binding HxlR family transcriptional regulator
MLRLGRVHDLGRDLFRGDHLSAGTGAVALAIRELGFGVTRFNDIQVKTGAPRASLAARLRELEDAGLVERRRYSSHPPRDEYVLTAAGRALGPVLGELRAWGERHAPAAGATRATRAGT